jgi:hypothetical protein
MSLISEPRYSAYSWARQSGLNNLTVVDKVSPEMLHLVDAYWWVRHISWNVKIVSYTLFSQYATLQH